MAKASSTKPTKDEIVKSLKAAARMLNRNLHMGPTKTDEMRTVEEVVIYQVWCPRERKAVGSPTTDEGLAKVIRDDHNTVTGHNSRIIPD